MAIQDDPHGGRGQTVQLDRPLAGGESDHDLWGELLEDDGEADPSGHEADDEQTVDRN